MVRKILLFIALAVLLSFRASAGVEIHVDRERIHAGESFQLFIRIPGNFQAKDLDTRPLGRDFSIGKVEFSSAKDSRGQYSQWTIPLTTSQTGNLKIPFMKIRKRDVTPQMDIRVYRPSRFGSKDLPRLISVKMPGSRFVTGQSILYQTTVRHYPGVDISTISPPDAPGASVHQIGTDETGGILDGDTYITTTRRNYSVSFSRPGTYRITGPVVTGMREADEGQVSFVQNSNPEAAEVVIAEPKGTEPGSYQTTADKVTAQTVWYPKSGTVGVGEPIMEEITITGEGVSARDLPVISMIESPVFQTYKDSSMTTEEIQGGKIVSRIMYRYIYIPTRQTSFRFSSEQFGWYDLGAGTVRTITLPAPDISITGSGEVRSDTLAIDSKAKLVLKAALGVVIFLILVCIIYLLCLERIIPADRIAEYFRDRKAVRTLSREFSTTDPKKTYTLLLEWAKLRYGGKVCCLTKLPAYPECREEIDSLLGAVFDRKHQKKWDGRDLREKLALITKKIRPEGKKYSLNPGAF